MGDKRAPPKFMALPHIGGMKLDVGRVQRWAYEDLMGRPPPEPFEPGSVGHYQWTYPYSQKEINMPMSVNDSGMVNRILDYVFRHPKPLYEELSRPSEEEFRKAAAHLAGSADARLHAGWTREDVEAADYWLNGLEQVEMEMKRLPKGQSGMAVYLGKHHPERNNTPLHSGPQEEVEAFCKGVAWALEVAAFQPPVVEELPVAKREPAVITIRKASVHSVYSDGLSDVVVADYDYPEPQVFRVTPAPFFAAPQFAVVPDPAAEVAPVVDLSKKRAARSRK